MRLPRLLSCLLLVTACGDNGAGLNPMHTIDAPHHVDSPVDIDAPIDLHNGRVWAIGAPGADADGAVAYGFDDGVALPFDPGKRPILQIPGGTGVLQPKSGSVTQIFDTNGDKIAFIGNTTATPTQFDLSVADVDGSNATLLAAGTDGANPTTIQQVQLSPDGTKAAYTMAPGAAATGGFDLFVVNTTGTPAPVRVSLDRGGTVNTALNVLSFTWSADSKLIAFSGDLDIDKVNEAFVVDTTVATPTATTVLDKTTIGTPATGSAGVSASMLFDANDNLYFVANLAAASTQFLLFTATSTGTGLTNPTFVPARTDTTAADLGAIGMSPDGKTLVFNADAPVAAAYDLYAVDLTVTTPTAAKLTNVTAIATLSLHASFTAPLWFSPDGKFVAEVANWNADLTNLAKSRQEPFVTALDGSGTHRIVQVTGICTPVSAPGTAPPACDVSTIQWTKDSKSVYIHGDIVANNDTAIFKADPVTTDGAATPAFNVTGASGDFFQMVVR